MKKKLEKFIDDNNKHWKDFNVRFDRHEKWEGKLFTKVTSSLNETNKRLEDNIKSTDIRFFFTWTTLIIMTVFLIIL